MLWNAKNGSVPVGGTTMDYVRFGCGAKTLVVLPGLSDGLVTVKGKALMLLGPYRPYLKEFTVFMFSRKNGLPEECSIRQMAADQAEAMGALGIRSASVLGVSQGGMIAQYLAADFPELVEKLVLAVTAPYANSLIQTGVQGRIEDAKRGDHRKLMIAAAEAAYTEKKLKSYRRVYPFLGHVGKPKDYRRFLSNAYAILDFDARDVLSGIRCPTLILGAEEDKTVGAEASEALHKAIPGSEIHMFPGLGHAAFEEAPDFYDRVFRFL